MRIVPLVLLLLIPFSSATSQPPVIQHYIEGTEAREAGDYDGYIESMERALAEVPGHAVLLRHLAQGYTLASRPDQAVSVLFDLAATGAFFDLSANEDLASLLEYPGFSGVIRLMEENRAPLGDVKIAFQIEDRLLVPEGIAHDPTEDVFFLSSIHQRKIIRVTRDGVVSDFVVGNKGYFAGLGMKVDAERRRLWASSAVFPGMRGYREEDEGNSSLSCFDLSTGRQLRQVLLANDDARHNLNDLALDSEGRVYVTDAESGSIYLLEPDSDTLSVFLPAGALNGPNGIALDEERGLLYVSQYSLDVTLVDLKDRSLHGLNQPKDVTLYGVDGLYLHDGQLIAVQNHPSLDRIARFPLSPDGRSVSGVEVLVRRHELFEEPTTGVVAGDLFYFIGNSQIERFTNMEEPDPAMLNPIRILEISL